MNNTHAYASVEEHMAAMEERMDAILNEESDFCMTSIQVNQEDIAQF